LRSGGEEGMNLFVAFSPKTGIIEAVRLGHALTDLEDETVTRPIAIERQEAIQLSSRDGQSPDSIMNT